MPSSEIPVLISKKLVSWIIPNFTIQILLIQWKYRFLWNLNIWKLFKTLMVKGCCVLLYWSSDKNCANIRLLVTTYTERAVELICSKNAMKKLVYYFTFNWLKCHAFYLGIQYSEMNYNKVRIACIFFWKKYIYIFQDST